MLINITGGIDMTLFEVDEAANRIREEVDPEANIIFGSTFDEQLAGKMRISVVATGIDIETMAHPKPLEQMQKAVPAIAVRPAAASRPVMAPAPMHASADARNRDRAGLAAGAGPGDGGGTAHRDHRGPGAGPRRFRGQARGRAGDWSGRPFRPSRRSRPIPSPTRRWRMAAEPAAKAKARGPSLFERVTNAGRLIHPQDEAPAVDVRPAEPQTARAPEPQVEPAATQPAPQPAARPERPARAKEEDLLEIPAFLRRQAN